MNAFPAVDEGPTIARVEPIPTFQDYRPNAITTK